MMLPRRFLPSIASLLALEAVDRLGSATAAAEELSLTQSAISRQLKALEGQMGAQLLLRERNRLQLTPAARDYARQVRGVLSTLATASLKLKANPTGGSLNLAVLPAFGMHWLAPRLKDFARRHPEVTVNLSTRLEPFSFAVEPLDAAIHFGRRDWAEVGYLPLVGEAVIPVGAPALVGEGDRPLRDVLDLPLLHLQTRPDAWEDWFARKGLQVTALRGMLFDQFSTMAQAAIHGIGVALLPDWLAEPELATGRLRVIHGAPEPSPGQYYLVWPLNRPDGAPLAKFRDWLATQVD
jgi:LysR family transcriptional regulator, glycine cleavage system transcriptional activator